MKAILIAAVLLGTTAGAALAHPCGGDAQARAAALLAFHYEDPDADVATGDEVKELPPLKALRGSGKFDVLEVWGYIYKAEYRMRFIYAQIPGSCVLMGQEIIEASDPY